jgi:hypothetical protein
MLAAVAKCSRCSAVVNTHWSTCLVCRAPAEAGSPPIEEVLLVDPPVPPLASGWLVAYRNCDGQLRGGCDEREAGTVAVCHWDGIGWTVCLTDGQQLPLSAIRSVAKTGPGGCVIAAWMVREHGADGNGTFLK